MSRMIKESSIKQLKEQMNIVDVIGSFVELKKQGANYKVCCPFHGEETASFVVVKCNPKMHQNAVQKCTT